MLKLKETFQVNRTINESKLIQIYRKWGVDKLVDEHKVGLVRQCDVLGNQAIKGYGYGPIAVWIHQD